MAKRKKSDLDLALRVIVLVFAVAAVCFGFIKSVAYMSGDTLVADFSGFQALFGYSETSGSVVTVTVNYLAFSFMMLLAFIMPIAGAVLGLFKNKLLNLIGAACFIVGAVFFFLTPAFAVVAENNVILQACTAKLAVGAILSGVASILGALTLGYVAIKK